MNISIIINVLAKGDKDLTLDMLANLYCLFDSDNSYSSNYTEVINELILYALEESDIELKREAFSTLAAAASKLNIEKVQVARLADNLGKLTDEQLQIAIDLISATHNRDYIPLLSSYRHHTNNTVAFSAGVGLRAVHEKLS